MLLESDEMTWLIPTATHPQDRLAEVGSALLVDVPNHSLTVGVDDNRTLKVKILYSLKS